MLKINQEEFKYLVKFIKTNYGVDLSQKRHLVEGRLSNFITQQGYTNYMDYFKKVTKRGSGGKVSDETNDLLNLLTTNHTFFLRESSHFDYYRDNVLPWIDKILRTHDLRVWSAGCSSGEEPYTLCMINHDYVKDNPANDWDINILATDISNKVLEIARKGIYSEESISKVPVKWRNSYFTQIDRGNYQVKPEVRKNVIFGIFNLLSSFPFKKKLHAVFCRNVMIYFDMDTKIELIKKIYDVLVPGGYLFIGHSESLSNLRHDFAYIMPSVYRKEQ